MKCDKVLYFFEKINEIPRGSGNEKAVSDYIVSFAKERGLWVSQDEANNVIIKKPATKKFEKSPVIVIQGHMDMVCEKESTSSHNFETDGIKMIYDGDFLHADGTTLGADDGIAVAMALALLDADDIEHPALECVFTTDEEVGMLGAASINPELIEGRIMLNIDSEVEGIFTVGCAGGVKTTTSIPVEYDDNIPYDSFALISIDGLAGGHSGIEINKERGNANKLLARAVYELSRLTNIRLCSIDGGAKDNAIPRTARAVVCCEDYSTVERLVKTIDEEIGRELFIQDKNVKLSVMPANEQRVFSAENGMKILQCIMLIPNGVQTMNTELNMPETSNNLGVVRTNNSAVEIVCAVRSSFVTKKRNICNVIESIGTLCGGNTVYRGDYPAWEYNPSSRVKEVCTAKYKEMYGVEPAVETVHAGLECGLFAEKIPDMDMISFGPDLLDIHTPKERARLSSVERIWSFLIEVLKEF